MKEPPLSLPNFHYLSASFEGRRLLPPMNQREDYQRIVRGSPSLLNASPSVRERPRSNLTALLNGDEQHQTAIIGPNEVITTTQNDSDTEHTPKPGQSLLRRQLPVHMYEADSASGPSTARTLASIAQSAPTRVTDTTRQGQRPPDDSHPLKTRIGKNSSQPSTSDFDLQPIAGTKDYRSVKTKPTNDEDKNLVRR